MNNLAYYVYFANPNKVYGPFHTNADAKKYANNKGIVTQLTCRDIICCRIRVTGL